MTCLLCLIDKKREYQLSFFALSRFFLFFCFLNVLMYIYKPIFEGVLLGVPGSTLPGVDIFISK